MQEIVWHIWEKILLRKNKKNKIMKNQKLHEAKNYIAKLIKEAEDVLALVRQTVLKKINSD